jgi:hypothetical protein
MTGWVFEVDEALQRQADTTPCLESALIQHAKIVSYFTDDVDRAKAASTGLMEMQNPPDLFLSGLELRARRLSRFSERAERLYGNLRILHRGG